MLIDQLRRSVIEDLYKLKGVKPCWPVWRKVIGERIQDWQDPEQVLRLGEYLSNAFAETKVSGPKTQSEEQSATSGGGAAWEALVCWYMNLCLIGTQAVVVKKRSTVQGAITDAIAVKYGAHQVNSESDLMAITFPAEEPYSGQEMRTQKDCWTAISAALSKTGLKKTSLAVIQCKTNWNDNAQIPMLWNLVYQAESFRNSRVSVGVNNVAPQDFKTFRYAFVTVPTNKIGIYKSTSTAVIRLADLSGGHYWGRPTKNGVSAGLHEIFATSAIGPAEGRGVKEALRSNLRELRTKYSYFGV